MSAIEERKQSVCRCFFNNSTVRFADDLSSGEINDNLTSCFFNQINTDAKKSSRRERFWPYFILDFHFALDSIILTNKHVGAACGR